MGPLKHKEYSIPIGKECLVPSKLEALIDFSEFQLYGTIEASLVNTSFEQYLCWIVKINERIHTLNVLTSKVKGAISSYTILNNNQVFVFNNKIYKIVEDTHWDAIIKEITILATEKDVLSYCMYCYSCIPKIHIVKIYKMGKKREFLFCSWYAEMPDEANRGDAFIPIFLSIAIK